MPGCSLRGRGVLPRLVVALPVTTMQCIKNPQACTACSIQDLQHVWDTIVGFGNTFHAIPELASHRDEVVVGIDYKEGADLFIKPQSRHDLSDPASAHS